MREIVLEARAVTRTYGTGTGATHALRGVDVEIEQGRFTAIIGASGCGKSTLLQALGGLDAPTSGKVLLEGQDLYALPDAALARALITRPAVVLADEPTGNLDHQNSVEVFRLLREAAAQQHQTVVYVTHDQGLAAQADRVLRMQDGRIEEA